MTPREISDLVAERDALAAEVAELRAFVTPRPMATAPKDGTSVIARWPAADGNGNDYAEASWRKPAGYAAHWCRYHKGTPGDVPNAWLPFPGFELISEPLPEGRTHELKTWLGFYDHIATHEKTFEIRPDDRDFQIGDVLVLYEWDPQTQESTGRSCARLVTYVMRNAAAFGLADGFVAMGLRKLDT